jgi:hypothetical protein
MQALKAVGKKFFEDGCAVFGNFRVRRETGPIRFLLE